MDERTEHEKMKNNIKLISVAKSMVVPRNQGSERNIRVSNELKASLDRAGIGKTW